MAVTIGKICMPSVNRQHETDTGPTTDDPPEGRRKAKNGNGLNGLERQATTALPTCCTCSYPPGSMMLECRFDGCEPVAQVVQVPGDRRTPSQKTCLLLETKGSQFGPSSRIMSQPKNDPRFHPPSQNAMTYCLESRECSDGAMARVVMIPTDNPNNRVTTLETLQDDNSPEKPSSKIVYGPAIEESCNENRSNEPVTVLNCTVNRGHPQSRITRCLKSDSGSGRKHCFEVSVPSGDNSPTAIGYVCSPQQQSDPCHHSVIEVKVDERGTKARAITCPQDDTYCTSMETMRCKDGPIARMIQLERGTDQYEASCAKNCEDATSKPLQNKRPGNHKDFEVIMMNRRNGLDPPNVASSGPAKRNNQPQPRRHVCPPSCCKPTDNRPKSCGYERHPMCRHDSTGPSPATPRYQAADRPKSCSSSFPQRRGSSHTDAGTTKYMLVPCMVADGTKTEGSTKPRTQNCASSDELEVSPEELLTRYREFMPPNMLFRYETCRSKRNGLQDECVLPVPRTVLEMKRREMLCHEESDESDSSRC